MHKSHYAILTAALALFLALYLGFDTKSSKQRQVEQSRALKGPSISTETLLNDARQHLDAQDAADIAALERQLDATEDTPGRIALLKKLSARWHQAGILTASGTMAEQVAELEQSDSAWSVAGAIFYDALVRAETAEGRSFCAQQAVKAFESAISLNPAQVEHRVNLALIYAENPPPDNPMQAVMMLRDLQQKHPQEPSVYNALGRLAIKTGQWERAIERLETAYGLDPQNPNTPCLLARAYEGAGNTAKASEFQKRCNTR